MNKQFEELKKECEKALNEVGEILEKMDKILQPEVKGCCERCERVLSHEFDIKYPSSHAGCPCECHHPKMKECKHASVCMHNHPSDDRPCKEKHPCIYCGEEYQPKVKD